MRLIACPLTQFFMDLAGYVSTIDSLVGIIGIIEYDGLPKLDGVIKDYENVMKTF